MEPEVSRAKVLTNCCQDGDTKACRSFTRSSTIANTMLPVVDRIFAFDRCMAAVAAWI